MIDLTGEELMLAERIVGETDLEPEHNHEDDFRDQQESADSWLAAEEGKSLGRFSE